MPYKVRGDRQVGHCLSAARLAEIRSAAQSLLVDEKHGAGAVADALIKAAETVPYNVRAQLAVELSKACISTGKRDLFESVLDALLSQDPLSADDAVDDLDFALDNAEDDDTFIDVKTSNRSNMHTRHTHHHLGLTMSSFSSSVKDRCLRALHDSNTLMYPKAASLLCSFQHSAPITSDAELIALASNPRCIPRRVCILMAACMTHKRTAVCDALVAHFWSSHHHARCAVLLPACSVPFVSKFVHDHPQVMTESEFQIERFLKAHSETCLDLFEAKLKRDAPLLRFDVWKFGPFHKAYSSWLHELLQHSPAAHIRVASLIRAYPALTFSPQTFQQIESSLGYVYGTVSPTFPLHGVFRRCILEQCKVKGKSNEFWSLWFPLLLDAIATQCSPVLKKMLVHSAFDIEDTREACKIALLGLLDPQDRQNDVLVQCLLRSHTCAEVLSFQQLEARTFRETVALAKQVCAHPAMSRAIYRDYRSILDLPYLNQEQYSAVLERILSVADRTEAHSDKQYMHLVAKLSLGEAFGKVMQTHSRHCGLYGASWLLAMFTQVHRFSTNALARIAAPAAVEPLSPQQSLDAISNLWKESSKALLACFFERALIHGESSLLIDGSVVPNAVFFSQQLDAWSTLQDEFQAKFIAAAAATAKNQLALKWNRESIDGLWYSLAKEILLHLASVTWEPSFHTGKTFGFPAFAQLQSSTGSGKNSGFQTTARHYVHPSVLQALVGYVLKASASLTSRSHKFSFQNSVFDIVSALVVRCFHFQLECLESADPKAKQLFESLDSVVAQLGEYSYTLLSSNFQGDAFPSAAIKFIQLNSNLAYIDDYAHCFSLVTFLGPVLRQIPPFFGSRLSAGSGEKKEAISTVLRKLCGIFQKGSLCFGAHRQWLRAEGFSRFFGKTMEQHTVDGLEFLFQGCKACILQASSKGDLHTLSIDILSALCYRLKPSDPLYEPVIAFVTENMKAFSLVKQQLVLCDNIPGEALNEIAWDFATNPKLPESVREQALSRLDLNDPSKKQEILQKKCRARTFELRHLGHSIFLEASIQTCHSQWGTNFVSAVQEIYSKTANESAENLNSIHALLCTNLQSLQQSLETLNVSCSPPYILSPANSSDFQVVFKKIVCHNSSSHISDDGGEDEESSGSDGGGGTSSSLSNLREALVKFALFSAETMLHALPEQEFRVPVQNWISFAMAVKYAQEAQDNDSTPCEIARSFVLTYTQFSTNTAADLSVPFTAQNEKQNNSTQFVIACIIRAYEELGSLYPNPESDAVDLAPSRDLSCLSLRRLISLMGLCKPGVWMRTDIVSLLLLHWPSFDVDSIRAGSRICLDNDSVGDITFFFMSFMNKWLNTAHFKNAHETAHSGCDKNSAVVRNARFIPIQELDCMTTDLCSLTRMFLDTFIRSDRAACLLPHWLAFYSTGTIVYNDSKTLFTLFRRPTALPHVEKLLELCPSAAYIPFVNRFMVRFAQHLIPPQFLHPEPLRKEQTINGIFSPIPIKPGQKKKTVARGGRAMRGGRQPRRTSDAPKAVATPTTVLSIWMHGRRLHSCQALHLKHQLLKTFSDSSFGNPQRLKALHRATRLPSLSVYDILKTIRPEFAAPPLQVSVLGGFFSASLDFENANTLSVNTIWSSKDSMSLYPDVVDRHMAGLGQTLVSSGSYKCFSPIKIANDPSVTSVAFSSGSVSVDAIDALVASQIAAGTLSDSDLCVGVDRIFDPSKSVYELCFAWSTKPVRPSDGREVAVRALLAQLNQELKVGSDAVTQQKRRVPLQTTSSTSAKAAVFRKVTFPMTETSEKLVRECFDDNPVNLFPLMATELSKAAIIACGYCKESNACLDTLYSPRFLASHLSSAAVVLFERSSAVFPSGSSVSFAEKLLFRNSVFFPPKVTIQKSVVRVLTANIDETNSQIIMKVFRRCRHVSVLTLLIGTCLRLLRTPTKVELGKKLLLDTLQIAVKADSQTIAAFSKFCEVSFLTIQSFLDDNRSWNTPTRQELTQEWDTQVEVEVDLEFLPWYMDNIIIPMSRDCSNPDLRDFCIMARFCSDDAFKSSKNCVKHPDSERIIPNSIFTVDRALVEIEAARTTYLQYKMDHLPAALSTDNLDTFHRASTVATAAKCFISNMADSGDVNVRGQCMKAYTSWIQQLLPCLNEGPEIRFPMCRTQELYHIVALSLRALGHGSSSTKIDFNSDAVLSSAAMELCRAASPVPGLGQDTHSRLLFSQWILTSSSLEHFSGITKFWKECILTQVKSNPSAIPYQAKSFHKYLNSLLDQPHNWDCPTPAKDCPFACAAHLVFKESGPLFVAVSQHEEFTGHLTTLFADALKRFCNFHAESSLSELKFDRFHDMFVSLHPVINGCAEFIFDWFQRRIASCNASNLHEAAAFNNAFSFFKQIIALTKPDAIPKSSQRSEAISAKVAAMASIQSQIHTSLTQQARRMLESYIAKYCNTFADQGDEQSELPPWFVPVKTLGSILEAAVQAVQPSGLSHQIAAPSWSSNTPLSLFCLQIYLRLISSDQTFASPSIIIEQINNLCRSSVLFASEGDASALAVPETHFETVFALVANVAARYCIRSRQVLTIILKAAHDSRKEIHQLAVQAASAMKSSGPLKRRQIDFDCKVFCASLDRTSEMVKRIFGLLHTATSTTSPQASRQFYREEMVLHALNLCEAASTMISSADLHHKLLHSSFYTVIGDLVQFLKLPVSVGPAKFLYDDINRNRVFCTLVLSVISLPDMKLDTFQTDWFANRIRAQDSLLGSSDHYMRFLVQLHRLEYIVRASQIMIQSHFGNEDAQQDRAQLPAIMATFPPIFLAQFNLLWAGLFDSHEKFMKEQYELTKRDKSELAAQKLSDFTAFLASFEAGSVRTWLEAVTGIITPAPFFLPSGDIRLRPVVLAHYVGSLLVSTRGWTFGVLMPAQLLPLCAPVCAFSSPSNIIALLRAVFVHHRSKTPATKDDPIAGLTSFVQALEVFQRSLQRIFIESGVLQPVVNAIFDARLLICADFVVANSNPVFVAALRIIIRNENPPPLPADKPVSAVQHNIPPPPEAPLSAKQQAQIMAHAFGSHLLPLVRQANSSGGIFNESLATLLAVVNGAVTRD